MRRDTSRIGRKDRNLEPPTRPAPVTMACVDCGHPGLVPPQTAGRLPEVPYLCDACLEARVAAVKDAPRAPMRKRGRKKKTPDS